MHPVAEDVRIRPMAEGDLAEVMRIAAGLQPAPHWPQSAYLTAIDPAASPRRIALVLAGAQTGEVAGFAVASLIPPQAELESIAVAAVSQRCGLGRQLFDALAAELRNAGASEIILEVRDSNAAALAYYRSLGFMKTGRRPSYYTDPVEDAVLMRLRLR
jgi:ribosomal-protein-alanine N-acetyltransferase